MNDLKNKKQQTDEDKLEQLIDQVLPKEEIKPKVRKKKDQIPLEIKAPMEETLDEEVSNEPVKEDSIIEKATPTPKPKSKTKKENGSQANVEAINGINKDTNVIPPVVVVTNSINEKPKPKKKKKQTQEEILLEYPFVRYDPLLKNGLKSEEVVIRNHQGYTNATKKGSTKTILQIIITNVFTFFNFIFAGLFIWMMTASAPVSNFLFIGVVVINTIIGITQEIKAKKTIDKLSLLSAPVATVVRDGKTFEIPVGELVLDDIVLYNPGNQISADCEIQKGEVEVNESLLTGESVPVKKKSGAMIYAGSFIVSGTCIAQVENYNAELKKTENFIDQLASQAKKYARPKSEILNSLKMLLRFIGILIIPIGATIFYRSFFTKGAPYDDAVTSTAGAMIGMIPAGLFLLTTVALYVGVSRLAKRKTLVQELHCIEMLARVNVLCLDKTGTITDGTMSVNDVIEYRAKSKFSIKEIIGSMNFVLKETNQTAISLEKHFGKNRRLKPETVLPFSSDRKYSAVSFREEGTYVIGAPEFVLKAQYDKIKSEVDEYAKKGFRVLALAHSSLPIKDDKLQRVPSLVALIVIQDRIREEAPETLRYFRENGVAIKVISGDNPITVSQIADRVGVVDAHKYISLEGMTDEEVMTSATKYTVFGRVTPEQKQTLIKALKQAKYTVAMTGDGVNDILALKEADCSIAMASGSEAARNVSHLVLLDSNFASMPKVVAEGRRAINNIQRTASLFLVKTLFSLIISLFIVFGLIDKYLSEPGQLYPFKPGNLLLIEYFAIGIPATFLALQPNKNIVKGKFLPNVLKKALPGGLTVTIHVLLTFMLASTLGFNHPTVITLIVLSATFTCLVVLYNVSKPYNIGRSILVIFMFLGSIGAVVADFIFRGGTFFGIVPLDKVGILYLLVLIQTSYTIIFLFSKLFTSLDKINLRKKVQRARLK
ncbi:MAG TPA: HAD-IC family P-type ATPase [Bacilli bacterium]|nr:HAD-IC family P-type ATPase [Bacilli bacterium]